MKIVIDTNVLISALIFPGLSSEVFDDLLQNHEPIVSEFILNELEEKMKSKFKIPEQITKNVLGHIKQKVVVVEPSGAKPQICRDQDDDHIIWLADSSHAKLIITGDNDLLILKKYKDIEMISPRVYKSTYMSN